MDGYNKLHQPGRSNDRWSDNAHAKARSYSSIHLSIASSINTRSTSVNVLAICLNFGRNPFKAAKIRLLDSGDMLLPYTGAGDAAAEGAPN